MAGVVYLLCAVTALLCAAMLLRGFRQSGARLLLWAGLCFALLTLSNLLVFTDLLLVPQVDLYTWRNLAALTGMGLLLYGLVWDTR